MSGVLAVAGAAAGGYPKLTGETAEDTSISPANATAGLTFGTDGTLTFTGNNVPAAARWHTGTWITNGGNFTVRLTVSAGDVPTSGPAASTFHALSSARTWTLVTDAVENLAGDWLFEIGGTGDQVMTSATFNMIASREVA